jgi:hypothetical protein
MRSNVAIPTLKLANVPGEHGAVSERVRRSARQSSQPHHHSHHHYPRQSSSQQPQLIHMPRSARSPRSVRSPRSPRHHQPSQSPRSPRRRRGTVRRSGTHHSVVDSPRANVGVVHPSITTSSEGGGSGGVPLLSLGVNNINGGGGAVIVPASPRGLVRRNKAVSPRTRTKLRARFDAMPDSVLLLIFSFLSIEDVVLRVSLLNYRCYQLSQNSAVFESVDLSRQTMKDEAVIDLLCELGWSTLRSLAPPSTLTSRGLHALSTCRSLGVLQLRSNPTISSHLLQRVVEYAEWQLHTIDLTGIIVTDEVVLALADRFDHCLESVALVQMTPLAVTDRSVAHLMRQCHVLRHVSLRSCRSVTPLAFEDISSEQLESIDVADCNELDDRFVKRLTKIAPRLRSLVLSGLTRISDKPLIELLRGAVGLRDLALAECAQLTDAVLTTLTRKASLDLRSLDLVAVPLLSAAAIVPFIEKQCAHLQRMRFDHSPAARCEPVLHALASKCAATLTFLNLRHGDAQTQLSAESLAVLPRFTHLQHLDVSECGDNVTAMLLGELFGQVRWLRELFADGCRGLTNQLIRKLMLAFERDMFDLKLGSLALLERISLVGCESVSQEALLDGFRTHRPRCVVNL